MSHATRSDVHFCDRLAPAQPELKPSASAQVQQGSNTFRTHDRRPQGVRMAPRRSYLAPVQEHDTTLGVGTKGIVNVQKDQIRLAKRCAELLQSLLKEHLHFIDEESTDLSRKFYFVPEG